LKRIVYDNESRQIQNTKKESKNVMVGPGSKNAIPSRDIGLKWIKFA